MAAIEEIHPPTADEADQVAWCEIEWHADREQRPGEVERPVASFLAVLRHPHAVEVARRWVARDAEGRVVGWSRATWRDAPENPRNVILEVAVHPEQRGRGIARALLRPAIDHAREHSRDLVTAEGKRGTSGESFLRALGAEERMVDRRSLLDVTTVDLDALREWGEPDVGARTAYELVQWRDACAEDILVDHAALRTAMNDAPREQLEWDDEVQTPEMVRAHEAAAAARGDARWTTCVRHLASGRLIALTDIIAPAGWPEWGYQEDTVVLGDHRGHGLGRWIKAANLLAVVGDRPQIRAIETWNAGSNRFMLAINDAMGFREAGWWGEWQIGLDDLESALGR